MKPNDILNALNDMDDSDIKNAAPKKRSKKPLIISLCGTATAAAVAAAVIFGTTAPTQLPHLAQPVEIAKAVYPAQQKFPTNEDYDNWYGEHTGESGENDPQNPDLMWNNAFEERYELINSLPEGYNTALKNYTQKTAPVFAPTEDENFVYSPINTYIALAGLSEVTGGDTSAQITALLGEQGQTLRENTNALWLANYVDDGIATCLLGNSMWLSDQIAYRAEPLNKLTEYYFTSSFCGEMGSADYNDLYRRWIDENTGGLLHEQAYAQELQSDSLFALTSTIYFKGSWTSKFSTDKTTEDIFHSPDGDITCDFMHRKETLGEVYFGRNFTAITLNLSSGYGSFKMNLVLPDEGCTAVSMLSDNEAMKILTEKRTNWENSDGDYGYKLCDINISMPKFDITNELELSEVLKTLGVTDVFSGSADFSPLCEQNATLSNVNHCARIKVDEEGCEGAAFTDMNPGMGVPPEDIKIYDFTLDRPFAFSVMSATNETLFLGTISNP